MSPARRARLHAFRRQLLAPAELEARSQVWAARLKPLHQRWIQGEISDAELAGLYLLVSLSVIRPGQWLVGPSRPLKPEAAADFTDLALKDFSLLSARDLALIRTEPMLFDLLNRFTLRGVRSHARLALLHWRHSKWPLVLTTQVPSAKEMLELQAKGARYVSLLFAAEELARAQYDHRDALSFLLHDLAHAFHFFSQPENCRGQVRIYRDLLQACEQNLFSEFSSDLIWQKRFDYLISDINSHPAHIEAVFWADLRAAWARKRGQRNDDGQNFETYRQMLSERLGWTLSQGVANG